MPLHIQYKNLKWYAFISFYCAILVTFFFYLCYWSHTTLFLLNMSFKYNIFIYLFMWLPFLLFTPFCISIFPSDIILLLLEGLHVTFLVAWVWWRWILSAFSCGKCLFLLFFTFINFLFSSIFNFIGFCFYLLLFHFLLIALGTLLLLVY